MQVSGQVTLGGTLDVTLIPDFVPELGNSFTILTFDSVAGDFDEYTGLSLGGGLVLKPAINGSNITLTVVQSEVNRPLLVIHGFAGSYFADSSPAGVEEWLTTRGIGPEKIAADPLSNIGADLIRSFENEGYVQDVSLFEANWDWRVPVAPLDGVNDGSLTEATTAALDCIDGKRPGFRGYRNPQHGGLGFQSLHPKPRLWRWPS